MLGKGFPLIDLCSPYSRIDPPGDRLPNRVEQDGSGAVAIVGRPRRLLCSLSILFFVAGTALLSGQSEAMASDHPTSVIVENTFPGLVVSPPGPLNGVMSSTAFGDIPASTPVAADILQDAGLNKLWGFWRTWRNPTNGDAVVIYQFTFINAAAQTSWIADYHTYAVTQKTIPSTPFLVPGIPGAEGYALHGTPSSEGPGVDNLVDFSKGNSSFLVQVFSAGDLTSANAVSLAQSQAAKVPGPATSSYYKYGEIAGAAVAGILIVGLIVVLSRRRKSKAVSAQPKNPLPGTPEYANSLIRGAPSNAQVHSVAADQTAAPTRGAIATMEAPQSEQDTLVYCSWCGKQRALNAPAIHHCGSRERPAVYCMKCGTPFEEGIATCESCGTDASVLSPS